jgi:hypothetical protein
MRFKSSMVSLGLLALTAAAAAQEANPVFSYSGFGTIGYVITDSDKGTFITTNQKFGATTHGSFEIDSNLGFQVNGKFNDTLSGTVQLLAQQDALGTYGPSLEWAFLKAKLGAGFSARVGRMGGPFFMVSDFRNVGYTNVSMRTPLDVYIAVPVRSFDGADLLYQGNFGNVTINGQLWGGKATVVPVADVRLNLNDLLGLSVSAEIGAVTLRAGHVETKFDSEGTGLEGFNSLVGGLKQLGALPGLGSLGTLSDAIVINGKKASFSGLGASVELGNWVGSAEVTKRKTDSLYVPDISSWYTTVGYRVKKFTPYVTLSELQSTSITSVATPSLVGYPPVVQGTVPFLIANVNGGILGSYKQRTVGFGSRWDLGSNYALKGEWAVVTVPADSSGGFSAVKGGRFTSETTINVLSLGLDFVF